MITLSLDAFKAAIHDAYQHYLGQDNRSFTITLDGYKVGVDVSFRGSSFDCGVPGFNMANADEQALRDWVRQNLDGGVLLPCKDVGNHGQVNALRRAYVNFNFHVNLVNPC